MVAATVATVIAGGAAGLTGVRGVTQYTGGQTEAELPVDELPRTPVAGLAVVDENDRLTAVAVLVLAPGVDETTGSAVRQGGSIVPIPASTDVNGGQGQDRLPLTLVYEQGGVEALSLALEGALRLSFDAVNVLDQVDVAALFDPVGNVAVDLPADVLDGAGPSVVIGEGPRTLTPSELTKIFTARASDQPDSLRRPNLVAAWRAIADTVGDGLPAPTAPANDSVAGIFSQLVAGPVSVRPLPGFAVSPDANPLGYDVEILDLAELVWVFASIAPAAVAAPLDGRIVQLVAPRGYDPQVRTVVTQMLYSGYNVVSVAAGVEQVQTDLIVFEDRYVIDSAAARIFLGDVRTPRPTRLVQGIDIVIVLGTSFLDTPNLQVSPTSTSEVDSTDAAAG
jgi:hypothetical protein